MRDLHPWAQGYPVAAEACALSLALSFVCRRVVCFPLPLLLPFPNNTQPLLSFITVVVAQLGSEDLQALL